MYTTTSRPQRGGGKLWLGNVATLAQRRPNWFASVAMHHQFQFALTRSIPYMQAFLLEMQLRGDRIELPEICGRGGFPARCLPSVVVEPVHQFPTNERKSKSPAVNRKKEEIPFVGPFRCRLPPMLTRYTLVGPAVSVLNSRDCFSEHFSCWAKSVLTWKIPMHCALPEMLTQKTC